MIIDDKDKIYLILIIIIILKYFKWEQNVTKSIDYLFFKLF